MLASFISWMNWSFCFSTSKAMSNFWVIITTSASHFWFPCTSSCNLTSCAFVTTWAFVMNTGSGSVDTHQPNGYLLCSQVDVIRGVLLLDLLG